MDALEESVAKRPRIQPNKKPRVRKVEIGLPICDNQKEEVKKEEIKLTENVQSTLGNINICICFNNNILSKGTLVISSHRVD